METKTKTKKPKPQSAAQRYYDALKRITCYAKPEWIRKHGEGTWGLPGEECLEMSYENIQAEAREAIKGRRRPRE
jgi:hypothetical protein